MLIYLGLAIIGVRTVLFEPLSLINIASLTLNTIIIFALLFVGGPTARTLGIGVSWLRVVLGGVLILFGLWEIVTLNVLGGLFLIGLGASSGIALGYWTIVVLSQINLEASH